MDSFAVLLIIRGLISFAGGSFVVTSLWTSAFFHSNCVGFANATTAGWYLCLKVKVRVSECVRLRVRVSECICDMTHVPRAPYNCRSLLQKSPMK